jgi:hypothetical protein
MNSQPKLGDRVKDCESLREWGRWQRHDSPVISLSAARDHSLRVMTHTDSIPHGGQTITKSPAVRSESEEMNPVLALRSEDEDEIFSNSQGNLEALDVLFSRYRRTLHLVAYRVLGDDNQAEDAVQRCLQSAASRNVPRFENEGAFRSWLVRVLIDVALFILQERAARILRPDQARIYPINPEFA